MNMAKRKIIKNENFTSLKTSRRGLRMQFRPGDLVRRHVASFITAHEITQSENLYLIVRYDEATNLFSAISALGAWIDFYNDPTCRMTIAHQYLRVDHEDS